MSGLQLMLALPFLTFTLFMNGCGYHNPYTAVDGKELPEAGIYIKIWENRTNELGLENKMNQALTDWLIQSKHLHLKTSSTDADYELTGAILSTADSGTSYDNFDRVVTLKTGIRASYALRENKTGKVIWDVADTLREVSYQVEKNTVVTRSNKQKALATLVNETAEDVYLRIFYTLTQKKNPNPK